ncbi:MAG: Abortive infection protein [Firmicutes bacterium]|nr:Abortive infection protein [Bacillota bacterium]
MKREPLNKTRFLLLGVFILVLIIFSNSLANFWGGYLRYIFYHFIYGIFLSIIVPMIYVFYYEKLDIATLGIKPITKKSIIIAVLFICFSVGGQMTHNSLNIPSIKQLIYISIPLIMTTFFEEFLFRGFLQTRIEKNWGVLPAILLSGLFFSLYHLGYPSFRALESLITLFCVGLMFALAFKLSDNHLLTSFLVNLPNAILVYLINPEKFSQFTLQTTIICFTVIILIILVFAFFIRKQQTCNSVR